MTKQEFTFEVLGGYLMDNNRLNVEYLASEIDVCCCNWYDSWNYAVDKKHDPKKVAINWVCTWINWMLDYIGYKRYSCTWQQVKKFNAQHDNGVDKVVDILTENIRNYQIEYN